MEKYKVGSYVRPSKDDNYTESDSINNQKNIIKGYIKENNEFELVDYYIDNWYTGCNFERPAFAQMCLDIVKKKINCVIGTATELCEKTNAVGIYSKRGKYGGTYAHKDIAFEFASAISPVFKLYLIKDLKN